MDAIRYQETVEVKTFITFFPDGCSHFLSTNSRSTFKVEGWVDPVCSGAFHTDRM